MVDRFPVFEAGHIFSECPNKIEKKLELKYDKIKLEYPCRIDAMAIDPSAVCYNKDLIFTPGEVVISINRKIKVSIEVISENGGLIEISERTKRKVLIKHAYKIMCKTLKVEPSIKIDVDASEIIKHCGFGSSSSTIAAVSAALNELYDCPISNKNLIKFLASNHGEEVDDQNEEMLKMVQCIGGGATNGLTEEGIIIIAGRATTIAKLKYQSDVLIGIPKNFTTKSADELMNLEEENLWKFKETGDKYSEKIAYELLHKALPDICNGNIRELSKVVFNYRFNMGSIENCSFVYNRMNEIASKIRILYENDNCELLTLSSVGPAFAVLVKDDKQKVICKELMEKLDMNIIETSVCNNTYSITETIERLNFWQKRETAEKFTEMPISRYVSDEIDKIIKENNISKAIDIGCGGGRYSKYLKQKGLYVLAVDKYKEMAFPLENSDIDFIQTEMNNIPVEKEYYDLILSIGVIHNAETKKEFIDTLIEFYRILSNKGYMILSLFTNDVITDDLKYTGNSTYSVINRPSMVLLSKNEIAKILESIGFYIEKKIDEHITDVGIGKRNVYTIRVRK